MVPTSHCSGLVIPAQLLHSSIYLGPEDFCQILGRTEASCYWSLCVCDAKFEDYSLLLLWCLCVSACLWCVYVWCHVRKSILLIGSVCVHEQAWQCLYKPLCVSVCLCASLWRPVWESVYLCTCLSECLCVHVCVDPVYVCMLLCVCMPCVFQCMPICMLW